MKIGNDTNFNIVGNEARNKTVRSPNMSSSDFGGMLKEQNRADVYQFLEEQRLKIEKQGQRLVQTANINELKYYKKMITDFLQQALYAALCFEKEHISDRRGRRHVYGLIKKVNERVEDLVRQVMSSEKDHLAILGAVDDIRGMLLDLIM
jgi:uncharacterized protein YaaR (DUF327 family)